MQLALLGACKGVLPLCGGAERALCTQLMLQHVA